MQESLFSPLWYRYAQLKPRLRSQVNPQLQNYRGQKWYLLSNAVNDTQFRVSIEAYAVIGRCDGSYTLQQIWDAVQETLREDAPTQDEVIQILNELDQREFLIYDIMPDVQRVFKRVKSNQSSIKSILVNPFAFKLPLANPKALLDFVGHRTGLIFNGYILLLWMLVMISGLAMLLPNLAQLSSHAQAYMGSTRYLFIAWFSYPVIKLIHELAHALAIKHYGGEVKEFGITLFMLTPAPYVDASAVNGFKSSYVRAFVSAVGIMSELTIAAIALWTYLNTQSGFVKDTAFVVAFICSISTLLFNGNPLLRFDGYYVMCDLFSLPNLAIRSRNYWVYLLGRWVSGSQKKNTFFTAKGEKKWLFFYAPLSVTYSLLLMFSLTVWAGEKSAFLGLLIALLVVGNMVIKPIAKSIDKLVSGSQPGLPRLRIKIILTGLFIILLLWFFAYPISYSTRAQGVVWMADDAQVRPEVDGRIAKLLVSDNQLVYQGQPLIVLENPDLYTQQDNLSTQLAKLEVSQFDAIFNNPELASEIDEEIKKNKAEQLDVQKKIDGLVIKSTLNGRFIMPHQLDMLDAVVKKGQILAYVLDSENVSLHVALNPKDISQIQHQLEGVEIKLAQHPEDTFLAEIKTITPATVMDLSSAALGDQGGGELATDPSDKTGLKLLEPIVQVEMSLPNAALDFVGGRAYVKFKHAPEPLASQCLHYLRQLFLSHFNTSD